MQGNGAGIRVRVTELKFVELWPVYQIIRTPGWSLRVWQAASKLDHQGPFPAPEQQGSRNRGGEMLPRCPGWFSETFLGTAFFRSDRHRSGNGDLVVFWHVLGRGHLEKFQARDKNRKTQFPGARGTFGEKNVATLSGMVFRKFLGRSFFFGQTHTGLKR